MSNEFLPTGYKVPSNNNYFRLKQGDNNFRILSSAIIGYEYWTADNKPVRLKSKPKTTPKDIRIEKNGKPASIKHFWAFAVWNYEEERAQIMELTQSSIQNAIKALVDNKKWGDPKGYDITITKSGEGLATEYNIMPNPHTPITEAMTKAIEEKPVNLDKLFDGEDPFGGSQEDDGFDLQSLNLEIDSQTSNTEDNTGIPIE